LSAFVEYKEFWSFHMYVSPSNMLVDLPLPAKAPPSRPKEVSVEKHIFMMQETLAFVKCSLEDLPLNCIGIL
jgi:hypothetical protein